MDLYWQTSGGLGYRMYFRCWVLAAADYLIDNTAVQSKFINGVNNNLDHVLNHMDKYVDFGRDDSFYHIPKDTYETILKVKNGLPVDDLSEKSKAAILSKLELIKEKSGGKAFEAVVQPSTSNYAEVQQGKVHETLNNRDQELKQENSKLKDGIKEDHKPSFSEAAEAVAIAGAVGGALSLGACRIGIDNPRSLLSTLFFWDAAC